MQTKFNPHQVPISYKLALTRPHLSLGAFILQMGLDATTPVFGGSEQVAQWATIAHHGASKMFGDTIIFDAQRQITLNIKH